MCLSGQKENINAFSICLIEFHPKTKKKTGFVKTKNFFLACFFIYFIQVQSENKNYFATSHLLSF